MRFERAGRKQSGNAPKQRHERAKKAAKASAVVREEKLKASIEPGMFSRPLLFSEC